MTKIEITEDRPLSYTCHDGTLIVVSVAGPVEKIYTLTVGGERILSNTSEELVRATARAHAEIRNARWNEAMRQADASVTIDHVAPAPQIASPLIESERQCSGLAGGGGAANKMSTAVRERLRLAVKWTPEGQPVVIHRCGRTNGRMLKAMARRGWLELDSKVRPSYGTVTDAGRRALAAELARTARAR